MNEYTEEMVAELRAAGPIDNDFAKEFADKYGISVHSVRQKAVRDEQIGYRKKEATRKDGSKVENKAAIVADIASLCSTDADSFETLTNANRNVLVSIRSALQA